MFFSVIAMAPHHSKGGNSANSGVYTMLLAISYGKAQLVGKSSLTLAGISDHSPHFMRIFFFYLCPSGSSSFLNPCLYQMAAILLCQIMNVYWTKEEWMIKALYCIQYILCHQHFSCHLRPSDLYSFPLPTSNPIPPLPDYEDPDSRGINAKSSI